MIDVRSAILLILIVESLLFSAQLLGYKNHYYPHKRVLGVFMLVMGVFLTSSILKSNGSDDFAIFSNYIILPLFLCINPFYYVYTKSLTTSNYKFGLSTAVKFFPAILVLILNIFCYSLISREFELAIIHKSVESLSKEPSIVIKLILLIDAVSVYIYYIQLVVYVVLMMILLRKHEKNIKYIFSYDQNISLKWVKAFVVIIIINSLLEIFIVFISIKFPQLPANIIYLYYFFLFLLITILGYFGLKQNEIYQQKKNVPIILENNGVDAEINKNNLIDDIAFEELSDEDLDVLPVTYMISTEEQQRITQNIIELVEKEKIFQNSKLSVYDLAEILKTNKTYISVSINNVLKKNFRQFINEYRIDEAKKLLVDPKFDHISIEGIAQTVGFISKSTFNVTFKKQAGVIPSDYRKAKL